MPSPVPCSTLALCKACSLPNIAWTILSDWLVLFPLSVTAWTIGSQYLLGVDLVVSSLFLLAFSRGSRGAFFFSFS
jgi:hypothetical protein